MGGKQQSKISLRDRKKLQLRSNVQKAAFALFKKYGYEGTTMSRIASAAGISRSTLFRHFATKEAVVLYDALDLPLADAFRRQPQAYTTIQALQSTLREAFLQDADSKDQKQREHLIRTIPALRSAVLSGLVTNIDTLAALIAERTNRAEDDILVHTLASVLTGVALGVFFSEQSSHNSIALFEESLAQLENSLHI